MSRLGLFKQIEFLKVTKRAELQNLLKLLEWLLTTTDRPNI